MAFTIPTTTQLATTLHRNARLAAPCIALVCTAAVLLTQLAYDLGRLTGEAVYARADQLRQLWLQLCRTPSTSPSTATIVDTTAPIITSPVVHPLAVMAADLEAMTTRQLQQLTGCRRRLAKRQLIALALAA